jgi:hypothetical protein
MIHPTAPNEPNNPNHILKETSPMSENMERVISPGYKAWMGETARAASKELQFGTWWRLDATYWRVAWLEATGELYAVERGTNDHFVVIRCLEKKEISALMRNWYDGDDLNALLQRCAPRPD